MAWPRPVRRSASTPRRGGELVAEHEEVQPEAPEGGRRIADARPPASAAQTRSSESGSRVQSVQRAVGLAAQSLAIGT